MKTFIDPVIEILTINSDDVISTSTRFGEDNPCGVLGEVEM